MEKYDRSKTEVSIVGERVRPVYLDCTQCPFVFRDRVFLSSGCSGGHLSRKDIMTCFKEERQGSE